MVAVVAGVIVGSGLGLYFTYRNLKFQNDLYNATKNHQEVAAVCLAVFAFSGFMGGLMVEGAFRAVEFAKTLSRYTYNRFY